MIDHLKSRKLQNYPYNSQNSFKYKKCSLEKMSKNDLALFFSDQQLYLNMMYRITSGISEHVPEASSIVPDQHLCFGDGSGGVEGSPAHR